MAEPRFLFDWRLVIEHEEAAQLAQALAPETDDHAHIAIDEGKLVLEGQGSAGESLHTVDDVLACLTGAVEALEAGEEPA